MTTREESWSLVFAEGHVFRLEGARAVTDEVDGLVLTSTDPGLGPIGILTGVHTARVRVATAALDTPPDDISGDWPSIVERSIEVTDPQGLRLSDPGGARSLGGRTAVAPLMLRLRVHARNRDDAYDGASEEPQEEYLLMTWPAEPAGGLILRDDEAVGTELRQLSASIATALAGGAPAGARPAAAARSIPARGFGPTQRLAPRGPGSAPGGR